MNSSGKMMRAAVFAAVLLVFGCHNAETLPENPPAKAPEAVTSSITIIAAGDNLVHDIIYNHARVSGEADRFDFDPAYAPITDIIASADIAFVNQETVMGGKEIGYSGYPSFNTPEDAGKGLVKAGFTVVNLASNHSLDRGEKALMNSLNFWKSQNVTVLGVFESEAERAGARRVVEKNGVKTGFLSYTYGLNGYALPLGKPWMIGVVDREIMAKEIDTMRPLCDLLVVSMHWGNEFYHTPSDEQKALAAFLAERKVDVVIGHHPHVTQPAEVIRRPDGKYLFVYYSLGDLLSHTQSDRTPDTMTGALAYIRVKKTLVNGTSSIAVETAEVIPTVCHYGTSRNEPFIAYPLWDYSEELAAKHYKRGMSLDYLGNTAREVFGNRVMEKKRFERFHPCQSFSGGVHSAYAASDVSP